MSENKRITLNEYVEAIMSKEHFSDMSELLKYLIRQEKIISRSSIEKALNNAQMHKTQENL